MQHFLLLEVASFSSNIDLEIQKIIYEKSSYYNSSPVPVALWSSNYLS